MKEFLFGFWIGICTAIVGLGLWLHVPPLIGIPLFTIAMTVAVWSEVN